MTRLLRLAIRPLPSGPVTRDAVEGRLALMRWSHAQTLEPDDVYGAEIIWTRADGDELHDVEDGVTGQPHWIVRAPFPEVAAAEVREVESPDPSAQRHALATIANLGWAELAPLANAAVDALSDPGVRARARCVVEAYKDVARGLGTSVLLGGEAWRPEEVMPRFRALERRGG